MTKGSASTRTGTSGRQLRAARRVRRRSRSRTVISDLSPTGYSYLNQGKETCRAVSGCVVSCRTASAICTYVYVRPVSGVSFDFGREAEKPVEILLVLQRRKPGPIANLLVPSCSALTESVDQQSMRKTRDESFILCPTPCSPVILF